MTAMTPGAVTEPESFARPAELHALFRRLRAEEPIVWVEEEGFPPFWLVTRHDDILAIEKAPEDFIAGPRALLGSLALEAANKEHFGDINGLRALVHMDGEEHRQHRMIMQGHFSRGSIEKLRSQIETQADAFIDKMAAMGGTCDFAADIAFWFPLRVVLSYMGLPEEDDETFLRLTQRLFAFMDPELGTAREHGDASVFKVVSDFAEYLTGVIEARRAEPQDDLASVLANAVIDGQPIDPFKQLSYFILLTTAGHDTTSAAIAEGMNLLIEQPEILQRLKEDPDLYATTAEEIIRLAAPVKHFMRTAARDIEIGGVAMKEGDTIMLAFSSGARDEAHIDDPDRATIDRPINKHIAYGAGPHSCLGKYLARMEVEIFFQRLVPRLKSVERAGPKQHTESIFVSGIKKLPIRYEMD